MNISDSIRKWEEMSEAEQNSWLEEEVMDRCVHRPVFLGPNGRYPYKCEKCGCFWLAAEFVYNYRLYTSISSPRSLVDELEAKTIEKVGHQDYIAALWKVLGLPLNTKFWTNENFKSFDACIRATAEQRCLACYLAVSIKSGEGV